MFKISSASIDPAALLGELRRGRAGACVVFEGRVRDLSEGRPVVALDYEAYVPLAEKEGGLIISEAVRRFPILAALCVHRTGSLATGDLAVWTGVAAEHRGAAFDACRYIIDEAKLRVPVWKRERYVDGTSEWINCAEHRK